MEKKYCDFLPPREQNWDLYVGADIYQYTKRTKSGLIYLTFRFAI